jgi:hypothetical protein
VSRKTLLFFLDVQNKHRDNFQPFSPSSNVPSRAEIKRDEEFVFVSTVSIAVFHIPNSVFWDNINVFIDLPPSPNPWPGPTAFTSHSVSKDDGQFCCGRISIFIGSPHVIFRYGVGIQIFTEAGFYNSELMILQTSGFTMFSFISPPPPSCCLGVMQRRKSLLYQQIQFLTHPYKLLHFTV